jgi:hypothetical protein
MFILEDRMNDYQRKKSVQAESEKIAENQFSPHKLWE